VANPSVDSTTSTFSYEYEFEPETELLPTEDIFAYGTDLALAEENLLLGNFKEAIKMAESALQVVENSKMPHSRESVFSAYAHGVMGDAEYKQKKFKESADRYKTALRKYVIDRGYVVCLEGYISAL